MICESAAAAEPGGLEVLGELAQEPTPKKAAPLLTRLTYDDGFLRRRNFPLLLRDAEGADGRDYDPSREYVCDRCPA